MLSSNDWHQQHDDFLTEAQRLLYKSEECLSHLELISDDEDAINGLLTSLLKLTETATHASVQCIAEFCAELRKLLGVAGPQYALSQETLLTVKHCLELISWQLELLDPRTGELLLDREEQRALLNRLATLSSRSDTAADHTPG